MKLLNKEYLLKITLNKDDIGDFQQPPPFYMKISWYGYLWQHLSEINIFFKNYAQQLIQHKYWFEINQKPVVWDKPFGVVLDLYVPLERQNDDFFEVIFYCRNFPASLGAFPQEETLKNSIIHSIKNACWIRSEQPEYGRIKMNG